MDKQTPFKKAKKCCKKATLLFFLHHFSKTFSKGNVYFFSKKLDPGLFC
jgi:hypothetical protein